MSRELFAKWPHEHPDLQPVTDSYINAGAVRYGAIHDGTIHYLDDAGYTLASAQAKWPNVTITDITTQCVDWCALTQALHDADAAGVPLQIDAHNYVINEVLDNSYGVNIYGAGHGVDVTVQDYNPFTYTIFHNKTTITGIHQGVILYCPKSCVIENIGISYGGTDNPNDDQIGIKLGYSDSVGFTILTYVVRCTIYNCNAGIHIGNVSSAMIQHCQFRENIYGIKQLAYSALTDMCNMQLTDNLFSSTADNTWNTSSDTELTIGTGNQTLTVGTGFSANYIGRVVEIAESTAGSPDVPHYNHIMRGTVTAYNPTTGEMDVSVDSTFGSGTYSHWYIRSPYKSKKHIWRISGNGNKILNNVFLHWAEHAIYFQNTYDGYKYLGSLDLLVANGHFEGAFGPAFDCEPDTSVTNQGMKNWQFVNCEMNVYRYAGPIFGLHGVEKVTISNCLVDGYGWETTSEANSGITSTGIKIRNCWDVVISNSIISSCTLGIDYDTTTSNISIAANFTDNSTAISDGGNKNVNLTGATVDGIAYLNDNIKITPSTGEIALTGTAHITFPDNTEMSSAASPISGNTDKGLCFYDTDTWSQHSSPSWDADTTYTGGDLVYDGGAYYISLQINNTNHATSDTDWWRNADPIGMFWDKASGKFGINVIPNYINTSAHLDVSKPETDGYVARFFSTAPKAATEGGTVLVAQGGTTAMSAGDRLGAFIFQGVRGSGAVTNAASLDAHAEEAWDATHAGSKFIFKTCSTGGSTTRVERMAVTANGNVVLGNLGSAASTTLATDATDGFVYLPVCAGTPTGTPTAYAGHSPIVYDSTGNKLSVYDGGWVHFGNAFSEVRDATASEALTSADFGKCILIDTNITLPDISTGHDGRLIAIYNVGTSSRTVSAYSTESIYYNGAILAYPSAVITLAAKESVLLIADEGTSAQSWKCIGRDYVSSALTQANVLGVLDDESASALTLRAATDTDDKIIVQDTDGNTQFYVKGNGEIGLYDSTNTAWGKFESNNKKLGLGTGTNAVKSQLEVYTASATTQIMARTESTSASGGGGLILYHNNASVGLPSSADRLGYILFGGYDATSGRNAAGIAVYAEATWATSTPGPASTPSYLIFQTCPASSTTRTERMRITAEGNVVVGNAGGAASGDLAANATNGFLHIPVITADPTSAPPTTYTGHAPMAVEADGSKLWIYVNGAWKSATLS